MWHKNFLDGNEVERKGRRIHSASAIFQKGIYHLFVLRTTDFSDVFDRTLRLYQCVFSICVAQLLLDFEEKLRSRGKKDKERVNRDPAAAITHSQIEEWSGFKADHPLYEVSRKTKQLYQNVVDARHNLIYRPYLEVRDDSLHWEDCELEDLLQDIPTVSDVEHAYRDFYKSIGCWVKQKDEDASRLSFFIGMLSTRLTSPPLTLLLNYARVLNPAPQLDLKLLDEIRKYRSQLLGKEFEEKYLDDLFKE